jgi:hypothetical protein
MPAITHTPSAASEPAPSIIRDDAGAPDDDLVPVYGIVWMASVGRVILAAFRHETFGAEATLALLAVALVPLLLLSPLRWLAPPRRNRSRGTSASEQTTAPIAKLVPRGPADRNQN